jgi:hypothetical protein
MDDSDANRPEGRDPTLEILAKRARRLTVAVTVMATAQFVLTGIVLVYLVDFHAEDPLIYTGVSIGAALVGFALGWFARRKQ